MAKSLGVIGIDPDELPWLRMFLFLMRHPDPLVSEMVRETLVYLAKKAPELASVGSQPFDSAG